VSAAPSDPHAARAGAEWTQRAERGSAVLIRFIVWFARRAGRGPARALLRVVTAYFFLFAGAARRASHDYLARCLGRAPTLAERYRHFFAFAAVTLDRVFFLEDRFELFEIDVQGAELFDERGVLLMGAHLGSFEAMRGLGRVHARDVAMAMYEENARKVQSALAAVAPERVDDVIALGRLDAMLRLTERLEAGALVGVLADRTLGDEPVLELPFLGRPAPFPTGPMRMAAALRARVLFMTGLYRGGKRYEVHFEPLADFGSLEKLSRAEREERVNAAVADYARRLEHYCRAAPDNFFNFYTFWK
jgi:predicted LPLAT superfamily acyltransferase